MGVDELSQLRQVAEDACERASCVVAQGTVGVEAREGGGFMKGFGYLEPSLGQWYCRRNVLSKTAAELDPGGCCSETWVVFDGV